MSDNASIATLIDDLVNQQHPDLRRELRELAPAIERIYSVHGHRHPELASVRAMFHRLEATLIEHLAEEDDVWFPHMRRLVDRSPIISKYPCCHERHENSPEQRIREEHAEIVEILNGLRRAADDFVPPDDACGTYRRTFDALRDLSVRLHHQIALENGVLIPSVKEREEGRAAGALG